MIRALLLALALSASMTPRSGAMELYSLGSGDLLGNYFASARAMCDILNRNGDGQKRCSPEPTSGSIYNLTMLRAGEMEFALVQSDWLNAAYEGTSIFSASPPFTDLRSVLSLYPETITLVVGADSEIESPKDLIGKRVDIGLPASGRHATVLELLARLNLGRADFAELAELAPRQSREQLCSGGIDAAIYVTGHPDNRIAQLIERCEARIVAFKGPLIDGVLGKAADVVPQTLPAGLYSGQNEQLYGYAVYATVVTRADVPDALVEAFVNGVLENLLILERSVPVLRGMNQESMQTRGLTAPLHPAAALAFAAAEP